MKYEQLEFLEISKEEKQNQKIEQLEKQLTNLRKGQFARGSEIKKEIDELKFKLDSLILAVCKNTFDTRLIHE